MSVKSNEHRGPHAPKAEGVTPSLDGEATGTGLGHPPPSGGRKWANPCSKLLLSHSLLWRKHPPIEQPIGFLLWSNSFSFSGKANNPGAREGFWQNSISFACHQTAPGAGPSAVHERHRSHLSSAITPAAGIRQNQCYFCRSRTRKSFDEGAAVSR